jgi:hypothetical protein
MTQTAVGVNAQVVTAPTNSAARRRDDYWQGFMAYCKGLSLADLSDRDEIRGWWSGNTAAGEADYAAQGAN